MKFDIRSSGSNVIAALSELQRKRLPEAHVRAANRTGREMVLALRSEMDRVFDRPTPWVKAGVKQSLASRSRPVFHLWIEEFGKGAGRGASQAAVLAAQISGGTRRRKRFEAALIAKGLMPANSFAVPGAQAPLDGYGNVPGPFVTRMLSDLRAFGEGGYRANRKGKRTGRRKTNHFFVPPKDSSLKPGIYWRMPGGLLGVVFIFVSSVAYQKRFDFRGVAERTFRRQAPRMVTEEVNRIMAG